MKVTIWSARDHVRLSVEVGRVAAALGARLDVARDGREPRAHGAAEHALRRVGTVEPLADEHPREVGLAPKKR